MSKYKGINHIGLSYHHGNYFCETIIRRVRVRFQHQPRATGENIGKQCLFSKTKNKYEFCALSNNCLVSGRLDSGGMGECCVMKFVKYVALWLHIHIHFNRVPFGFRFLFCDEWLTYFGQDKLLLLLSAHSEPKYNTQSHSYTRTQDNKLKPKSFS